MPTKKHRKLSPQKLEAVRRKYEEIGLSDEEIAAHYLRWVESENSKKQEKSYTLRWFTDERDLALASKKN